MLGGTDVMKHFVAILVIAACFSYLPAVNAKNCTVAEQQSCTTKVENVTANTVVENEVFCPVAIQAMKCLAVLESQCNGASKERIGLSMSQLYTSANVKACVTCDAKSVELCLASSIEKDPESIGFCDIVRECDRVVTSSCLEKEKKTIANYIKTYTGVSEECCIYKAKAKHVCLAPETVRNLTKTYSSLKDGEHCKDMAKLLSCVESTPSTDCDPVPIGADLSGSKKMCNTGIRPHQTFAVLVPSAMLGLATFLFMS